MGVITNEIYVDESVKSLTLQRIDWTSQTSFVANNTNLASVIYKPSSFNYSLSVSNSEFTCTGVSLDEDVIMQNNIEPVQRRTSLFRLG